MRFTTITYRVADEHATDYRKFYRLTTGDDRTDDEKLMNTAFCGIIRVDVDSVIQKKMIEQRFKDLYKTAKQIIREYTNTRLKELHSPAIHQTKTDRVMANQIDRLRAGKMATAKLTNDLMNYAQQLMF